MRRHLVAGDHLTVRGPWDGSLLFGSTFLPNSPGDPRGSDGAQRLAVTTGPDSTGPWTVTLAPVSSAEQLPARASGTGDDVFLYDGGFAEIRFRHPRRGGTDHFGFAQWLLDRHPGDFPRMAQFYVFPGPSVIAVGAAGAWRATVR